jgi:hypothetical protein
MIYVTPYRADDKTITGPSVDSGFKTMTDVVELMGEPLVKQKSILIYGPGNNRVLFSKLRFQL